MNFTHLLTDSMLVSKSTGRGDDEYGTLTYGPWVKVPCSFQEAYQMIRDSEGEERTSTHTVATAIRIDVSDRCILPPSNGVPPSIPQNAEQEARARRLLSFRNDRSRRSGIRLYHNFF
jgi:hypothetical protein